MFRVFDEDNSGSLNFYEFMCCKQTSLHTPQQKLDWVFQVPHLKWISQYKKCLPL